MSVKYPLRGIGPSTFLSYSYADRALATELANALEMRGLRVRKEDEKSLLGRSLPEALGKSIAEREVFLQLMTETARAYAWVGKEFEWAKERQGTGRVFCFIQLVAHGTAGEAIGADQEDARSGIADDLLDRVLQRSLETVQLLPMA